MGLYSGVAKNGVQGCAVERTYHEDMKKNVDDLLKNGSLHGKAVYIFGHCNATLVLIDYLAEHQIRTAAILDNNEAKLGMCYKNVAVENPHVVLNQEPAKAVVLIASRAYAAMTRQLRELAFLGDIYKVVDYNTFADYSLTANTLGRKIDRVRRGGATLEEIRRTYPSDHLVICPYDALGDVYQALSFLPDYCCKHHIERVAVLVVGKACGEVAKLFGRQNIMVLERETMDELVQAVLFLQEKNCIIAHHDRPYTNELSRYLNMEHLSFQDIYRYGVFGLERTVKAALPTGRQMFSASETIEQGNTVILAPYAKSVVTLPAGYWEALARAYQEKGYLVCTNTSGDEKAVAGTQALLAPICQMIDAAEYAGWFVGIRNGLCDILTTANCRKTVIFPDCYYSNTSVKVDQFFDLPGWEKLVVSVDGLNSGAGI